MEPIADGNTGALRPGRHVVEIDGVRQAYEVAGSGPVCVVHSGGPAIHSDYLRMPLLAERLTLVYLDPIGTGHSGLLPGGDYSVPTYARFARGVIDHLDVDRPFFLGHSHGGFVGQQLALDHPGLLGGLILYSSAAHFSPDLFAEATRGIIANAARWPDRPDLAEAARIWQGDRVQVTDQASNLEFLNGIKPAYFADHRRTMAQIGKLELDATYDPDRKPGGWDARDRIDAIDVPTLAISGRYDFICPTRWSEEIVRAIPNARLSELRDSGHFGHVEQPDDFARDVVEFTVGTRVAQAS